MIKKYRLELSLNKELNYIKYKCIKYLYHNLQYIHYTILLHIL